MGSQSAQLGLVGSHHSHSETFCKLFPIWTISSLAILSIYGLIPAKPTPTRPVQTVLKVFPSVRRVRFEIFRPSSLDVSEIRAHLGIFSIFDPNDTPSSPIGWADKDVVEALANLLSQRTTDPQSAIASFTYCDQLHLLEFSGFRFSTADFQMLLKLLKLRERGVASQSTSVLTAGHGGTLLLTLRNCSLEGSGVLNANGISYPDVQRLFDTFQRQEPEVRKRARNRAGHHSRVVEVHHGH